MRTRAGSQGEYIILFIELGLCQELLSEMPFYLHLRSIPSRSGSTEAGIGMQIRRSARTVVQQEEEHETTQCLSLGKAQMRCE